MHLEAVRRPLSWKVVSCWCGNLLSWCIKLSLAVLLTQLKMGGRKSKIQAENIKEENMTNSLLSVINLHASSATSGAMIV